MENSVYSIKDIKQINEEEFEAVFEIDDNGLPTGTGLWQDSRICRVRENLCKMNFFNSESDIQALEILKNQNLLVLGTEGIEINIEVHDNSEVKGEEDLKVNSKQF